MKWTIAIKHNACFHFISQVSFAFEPLRSPFLLKRSVSVALCATIKVHYWQLVEIIRTSRVAPQVTLTTCFWLTCTSGDCTPNSSSFTHILKFHNSTFTKNVCHFLNNMVNAFSFLKFRNILFEHLLAFQIILSPLPEPEWCFLIAYNVPKYGCLNSACNHSISCWENTLFGRNLHISDKPNFSICCYY